MEGRLKDKVELILGDIVEHGQIIEDADVIYFNNFGDKFLGPIENSLCSYVSNCD